VSRRKTRLCYATFARIVAPELAWRSVLEVLGVHCQMCEDRDDTNGYNRWCYGGYLDLVGGNLDKLFEDLNEVRI
jgi:hypothetical protein